MLFRFVFNYEKIVKGKFQSRRGKSVKKSEVKFLLQVYYQFKNRLSGDSASVIFGGEKRKIALTKEVKALNGILTDVLSTEECDCTKQILSEVIISGRRDKDVMYRLPVSESTYFRLKKELINKIYDMFIYYGFATKEEVLASE